jgi:hypothetical protein
MLLRVKMRDRNGFFTALVGLSLAIFARYGEANANNVFSINPASHVIFETHTGLALFGYDPVAYHSDGKASEGRSEFMAMHQNLVWRFVSAANREAFVADPSAYIPAFGGHDARAVSEGRMSVGDPTLFLISGGALTLFRSKSNRDQFLAEPEAHKNALARWPDVVRQQASH